MKIYLKYCENVTKYAQYGSFRIANNTDGYQLTIGDYSADAMDSMIPHNDGKMFCTKDRVDDGSSYVFFWK